MDNWGKIKPPFGTPPDMSWVKSIGNVGLWTMNERTGIKLFDRSGNNNTGTLTNMANPATATSGWGGQGLAFDGANDYVDFGNQPKLKNAFNNSWSVSTWVMPFTAGQGGAWIFCKAFTSHASPYYQFDVRYYDTGDILAAVARSDTFGSYLDAYVPNINSRLKWAHIVTTVDSLSVLKLYINGLLVAVDNTPTGSYTNYNTVCTIGCNINVVASKYYFNGCINNTSVYDRVLSADEVRRLYIEPYYMYPKRTTKYFIADEEYIETDKLQLINVIGSEIDSANRMDTDKLHLISVAQIEADIQVMLETGKEQTIDAITDSSDAQSMNELNKLQGMSVFQNITDIITANELDKLETIIVAQSELDTLTASELNKVQVILVIQTETDVLITIKIYDETGKVQTILVVQGKIDAITANEVGKSEIIAVEQSELDALMANEVDSLQIIAVEQSTSDSLVANEIYKIQEIQVIQSNTEHLIMDELGNEQIIVATQSATDILNGNELGKLCRILVVTDETDTQNMIETGKIVTIVCSESEVDYLINGDLARRFAGKKPYFSYTGEKPNKVTSGKKPYFKFTL
jgi:hypothetical protein